MLLLLGHHRIARRQRMRFLPVFSTINSKSRTTKQDLYRICSLQNANSQKCGAFFACFGGFLLVNWFSGKPMHHYSAWSLRPHALLYSHLQYTCYRAAKLQYAHYFMSYGKVVRKQKRNELLVLVGVWNLYLIYFGMDDVLAFCAISSIVRPTWCVARGGVLVDRFGQSEQIVWRHVLWGLLGLADASGTGAHF